MMLSKFVFSICITSRLCRIKCVHQYGSCQKMLCLCQCDFRHDLVIYVTVSTTSSHFIQFVYILQVMNKDIILIHILWWIPFTVFPFRKDLAFFQKHDMVANICDDSRINWISDHASVEKHLSNSYNMDTIIYHEWSIQITFHKQENH